MAGLSFDISYVVSFRNLVVREKKQIVTFFGVNFGTFYQEVPNFT
jgi:hypothetical protein